MIALKGYYDGKTVQMLEQITAKKNQKLIVTILDEFLEETPKKPDTSSKGILAGYADTDLWEKESLAWEEAMGEKHGNT